MFFAAGVSAYQASIFHLMTHAFFKALLFLAAGSVIHAMSGEQDMRKMGGLWRLIPITYAVMWIGSLGARRHPAVCRLFFEGHDSRGGLRLRQPRSASTRSFSVPSPRSLPPFIPGGCCF